MSLRNKKRNVCLFFLVAFGAFNFVSYFLYVNNRSASEWRNFKRDDERFSEDVDEDNGVPVVQVSNPWIDLKHDDDDDDEEHKSYDFEEKVVSGCPVRVYKNHSTYSKPEFAEDYKRFRLCRRLSKNEKVEEESWATRKIRAAVGKMGELKLKTNFRYVPSKNLY